MNDTGINIARTCAGCGKYIGYYGMCYKCLRKKLLANSQGRSRKIRDEHKRKDLDNG